MPEAQYGHRQLIYRWHTYQQERCVNITEQRYFGYLWLAPESFRNSPITKALVEAREKQIPYWAKEYGGKLDRMLKGPEARFQAQKQDFLKRLESYVQESLDQVSKSTVRSFKEPKFPTNPAQLAGSTE